MTQQKNLVLKILELFVSRCTITSCLKNLAHPRFCLHYYETYYKMKITKKGTHLEWAKIAF